MTWEKAFRAGLSKRSQRRLEISTPCVLIEGRMVSPETVGQVQLACGGVSLSRHFHDEVEALFQRKMLRVSVHPFLRGNEVESAKEN